MSKKSKEIKSTPELYHGITIDPKCHKLILIEDVHGEFYIFTPGQADGFFQKHKEFFAKNTHKKWTGIEAFMEENQATLLTYHENLLKVNPPKGQDILLTAQYIWAILTSKAFDHREKSGPNVPVSASGRKSTIGLSEYRYGEALLANKDPNFNGLLKTPQAKVCLRLFREAINSKRPEEDTVKAAEHVLLEADLRKYVEDHAGELHTRQDPWRIFQYYRKDLIEEKLIRRQ